MWQYEFVRRAFLASLLLSVLLPLIGTPLVYRKLSMLGDAFSHLSLSAVMVGLLLGISPMLTAIIGSILGMMLVDYMQHHLGRYADLTLTIIMALGVGLAGAILPSVSGGVNLESYLFGSLLTLSQGELWTLTILTGVVIVVQLGYFRDQLAIIVDPVSAHLAGIPVRRRNQLFSLLTAISVAVASKLVGVMIVASVLAIPVACAIQWQRGYLATQLLALLYSLGFLMGGLWMSLYLPLTSGSAIVLLAVFTLLLTLVFGQLVQKTKDVV